MQYIKKYFIQFEIAALVILLIIIFSYAYSFVAYSGLDTISGDGLHDVVSSITSIHLLLLLALGSSRIIGLVVGLVFYGLMFMFPYYGFQNCIENSWHKYLHSTFVVALFLHILVVLMLIYGFIQLDLAGV